MRRRLLVLLALVGVVLGSGCSEPAPLMDRINDPPPGEASGTDPKLQFVGNWELVGRERITPDGELLQTPEPPLPGAEGEVGYIMYDPAGYMGVVIMPPGRPPYASDGPTGEEAVRALSTYTSYFGTYTMNEAEGYLTHHLQGNVRPPDSANNNQRFYEFSGNQLILMPPADDSGIKRRIIWQRVPDLPEAGLTETHRRLFGFYRFTEIARTTIDGESLPADQWDNAFIIYMPSGYMAVHISPEGPARVYRRADPRASAPRDTDLRQLLRPVLRTRGGGLPRAPPDRQPQSRGGRDRCPALLRAHRHHVDAETSAEDGRWP